MRCAAPLVADFAGVLRAQWPFATGSGACVPSALRALETSLAGPADEDVDARGLDAFAGHRRSVVLLGIGSGTGFGVFFPPAAHSVSSRG